MKSEPLICHGDCPNSKCWQQVRKTDQEQERGGHRRPEQAAQPAEGSLISGISHVMDLKEQNQEEGSALDQGEEMSGRTASTGLDQGGQSF